MAGYLAVFLVTFLYLGFGIYAAERSAGKVRTRIGLYEHILARRAGGRGAGSEDQPTVNRERSATVDTNG